MQVIMVEGENYIGRGYHFTLGSVADVSDEVGRYLLSLKVKDKPQFMKFEDIEDHELPEEDEIVIRKEPSTTRGYQVDLTEWGVKFPAHAQIPVLKALWKRAAANNGKLNAGDMAASDLKMPKSPEPVKEEAVISAKPGNVKIVGKTSQQSDDEVEV